MLSILDKIENSDLIIQDLKNKLAQGISIRNVKKEDILKRFGEFSKNIFFVQKDY